MRTGSYPRLIALVESKVFTRIIIFFIIAAAVLVGLETSDSMLSKHGKLIHFLDGFILYHLGFKNIEIYDNSMSEWAMDRNLPIETD